MSKNKFLRIVAIFVLIVNLIQTVFPLIYQCYALENDIEENGLEENVDTIDIADSTNDIMDKEESKEKDEIISTNEEENYKDIEIEKVSNNELTEDIEETLIENQEMEEKEEIIENIDEENEILETMMINSNDTQEIVEVVQNENLNVMVKSGDFYIGNEAEFRNALANQADVIHVRQSIDFTAPVYINYPVRIFDESDDNALRYAGGGNFIIVQNGGSLTLDGMVVDTNSSGISGMTAINIEASGSVTFVNSSIVDGGLGNTGILINSGANLLLWSSEIVRCGIGINVQGNGSLNFATQEARRNNFYWNKTAVLIDNFSGNCDFSQNICMHDNTEYAIHVVNSSGSVNVMTGDYYNNTYCVRTSNGTATISGGSYHNNGWAIWCCGNINLTGGDIHSNYYGVITDESYPGNFVMTGGNIHDNTAHAIQHQKNSDGGCVILGGSISGDIYLEKNDNYVNTNSSYPLFTVTPSTYYFKRKLVRTTDGNVANSEINNVTLTPKDEWYKHTDREYIVLWQNCSIEVRCMDKDIANGNLIINGSVYTESAFIRGAKFNVFDANGNVIDTLITDNNGYAISRALPAATNYKVKQESTLPNYNIDVKEETVNFVDATFMTNFLNEHKKGNIEIFKIDYDNNKETVSDVIFELHAKSLDNPYKTDDLIGTYTTDKNGRIYVENLWTGDYYLVETKTQDMYRLNTDKIEVSVEDGKTSSETITNEKKKDRIEITVKDEDTDISLDNITFDILDENGDIVDTITTDENGYAISKDLPIDEKYTIIQKDKKDNYISNDEKIEVDFIKEFGYEDEKVFPISITNKHKEGDILLKKVDYDNNDIMLEGFEFGLYVQNVDLPYEADELIDTYVTDEKGEIHIEKIWTGDYYFKEIDTETSKYYRLIEDKIEVLVEENNISEIMVTNEKQKGKIEINKKLSETDSEITGEKAGTPLLNAIFAIYDEEGNEIERITTDENGYAVSNGLAIDKNYTIKEFSAPEFYLIDNEEKKIDFKEDNEIISLEWKNKAVSAKLNIEETGIIETQANDLIRYDIIKLENMSNVETENFAFEDKLPYEYVTLKNLYTGTYNYDKNYTVWYKVKNQEDWIQMINKDTEDGTYNTLKNNYIDFANINETITEFKIEFGIVQNDFSAIENDTPFIFVKVGSDVKNDDRWANDVKLTGEYISNCNNTIKIEDSSKFETKCYSKKLEINSDNRNNKDYSRKVLPKTGF